MDLVGKRRMFFILSAIVIIPGVIALLFYGLNMGIEFTSGSTLTVEFIAPVEVSKIEASLNRLGHPEAIVQRTGNAGFFIRLSELRQTTPAGTAERDIITEAFELLTPMARPLQVATVSPLVARDTVRNSFLAVLAAAVAILLYITWAFRSVPNSLRFGVAAIIAVVHDVLVVVGLFAILGQLIGLEVNAMFITGLLTIIGYSVHDTIVVFDRIRENTARMQGERFIRVVNTSLLETMGRSLNTSLTLLFTVLSLLILGGESIRSFLLVLLFGLTAGTYSSICIASQVLVVWETGEGGRFFQRRMPFGASGGASGSQT